MELRMFNMDLEPLGIIDEAVSVIWQPSYWDKGDYGDVKILAPITDNNTALLVKGNIIVRHGESAEYTDEKGEWRRAAQITYRFISKDINGAEQIEVQGCFLKKWLSKRLLTLLYRLVVKLFAKSQTSAATVHACCPALLLQVAFFYTPAYTATFTDNLFPRRAALLTCKVRRPAPTYAAHFACIFKGYYPLAAYVAVYLCAHFPIYCHCLPLFLLNSALRTL